MARPSKPANVIRIEQKSHRTKAELASREKNEKALLSSTQMKEKKEVKDNPIAHKEFLRIKKLLTNIEKNDALYEAIINRYCLLQAECHDLEERRQEFYQLIHDLREEFNIAAKKMNIETASELRIEYAKELARMMTSMINCDKMVQAKRKMLLDIEKECVMTIASSMRSIPKQQPEKKSALLEALGGSG